MNIARTPLIIRTFLAFILGISMIAGTVAGGATALAAEEVIIVADTSGYADTPISLDIQISGDDAVFELNLFVPSGSFSFGVTTDVTFTNGVDSGPSIQMSGTRTALNAALETLAYTNATPAEIEVDAWLGVGGGDFVYNSETKHVYQVVTPAASSAWAQAKALAEDAEFDGIPGYLATITTLQEHEFILPRISQDGWIGGTDSAVEGEWRWQTGPETGTQFWQGTATSTGGVAVGGMFAYWASNEPNNNGAGDGEDCTEIRFSSGAGGKWNDLPCGTERPNYVVEYGAGVNVPLVVAASLEIEVTAVPANIIALEKIQEYADGGIDVPTVQDYIDAGIEGVTADNLAAVNAKIAGMDPAELGDETSIQDAVTPVIAYEIIDAYATSNGSTTAPTVQDYIDAGIDGVTEENLATMNEAIAANGAVTDLATLQDLISGVAEKLNDRGSSPRSGSSVQSRVNALANNGNLAAAEALKAQFPHLFASSGVPGSTPQLGVRDMEFGLVGDDVRALQTLLIAQGYSIPAGATGYFGAQTRAALAAYQGASGIAPTAGYFGPLTRAQMKGAVLSGLWW